MKKYLVWAVIGAVAVAAFLFVNATRAAETAAAGGIKWYTWDEAMKLNTIEKRPMVIDVYTNWCHWCKVMDKQTFVNDTVAQYVNTHYYPIKLNAEQRDTIVYNGHAFAFLPDYRSHELAVALLDGQMSYPTLVYLNGTMERVMISPGYKQPADLMPELEFVKTEAYKTQTMEQFVAAKKK